jgi:hypothetical protein
MPGGNEPVVKNRDDANPQNAVYVILAGTFLSLALLGLLFDTPAGILQGLERIVTDPDYLITDYMGVGGIGAAFVNSGLVSLLFIGLLRCLRVQATGITIAAIWTVAGFSFFGKNLLNVWFIVAGVWLFARYRKEPFSRFIYAALFGTALAPLVTQILFGFNLPLVLRIPLALLAGLSIGFVLPPLGTAMMRFHQGFNLYNIGFVSGLVGSVYLSLFRSYGYIPESRLIWTTGQNKVLAPLFILFFAWQFIMGFLINGRRFTGLSAIMSYPGRVVTDFLMLEGLGPTLMNMALGGIGSILYILAIGGDINGPTLAGVFTVVGFSAFGKHLRNMAPIVAGVVLGGLTKIWGLSDPPIQLAALFATTLAPVAGEFGIFWGIVAGFLHSSLVLNVGALHGGFNLYNNGFSGGAVAAVLVPVIEALRSGRESHDSRT